MMNNSVKKPLLFISLVSLFLIIFSACGGGDNATSADAGLNAEYKIVTDKIDEVYKADTPTVQQVVDEIISVMPVRSPTDINDAVLDFLEIDRDNIEEYAGQMTMLNLSSDALFVIRAKPGKVNDVKAALIKRRSDIAKDFETYLEVEHQKAKYGKVIVKGNDVILAVLGDQDKYDIWQDKGGTAQ